MSDSARVDLYEILGVPADASTDDIKAAYRRQVAAVHPDRLASGSGLFRLVQEAYDTLSDPNARARYDAQRQHRQPDSAPSEPPPRPRPSRPKPNRASGDTTQPRGPSDERPPASTPAFHPIALPTYPRPGQTEAADTSRSRARTLYWVCVLAAILTSVACTVPPLTSAAAGWILAAPLVVVSLTRPDQVPRNWAVALAAAGWAWSILAVIGVVATRSQESPALAVAGSAAATILTAATVGCLAAVTRWRRLDQAEQVLQAVFAGHRLVTRRPAAAAAPDPYVVAAGGLAREPGTRGIVGWLTPDGLLLVRERRAVVVDVPDHLLTAAVVPPQAAVRSLRRDDRAGFRDAVIWLRGASPVVDPIVLAHLAAV